MVKNILNSPGLVGYLRLLARINDMQNRGKGLIKFVVVLMKSNTFGWESTTTTSTNSNHNYNNKYIAIRAIEIAHFTFYIEAIESIMKMRTTGNSPLFFVFLYCKDYLYYENIGKSQKKTCNIRYDIVLGNT